MMNEPRRNEERDAAAIEAEAVAWLAERDEGFAPGRAAVFEAWHRGDPRHAAAVAELEQLLVQLEGLASRREEVNARFNRVSAARPAVVCASAMVVRWWRPFARGGVAAASTAAPPPAVERLAPAGLRALLAWQRRVTDFSDTPLAEVAARFNRHNSLQLVVDSTLGGRRFGGMFALDDVEAFVRLLERDGIVRAERDGDTLRLREP